MLCRAGAAGLSCGTLSVAVYSAHKLFEIGAQDSLTTMTSDRKRIAWEAARLNLLGGYLGDQAEDVLANFGAFAKDLEPVLT